MSVQSRVPILEYGTYTREQLIARLIEVTHILYMELRDYYSMKGDECRSKAQAYIESMEQTVTGRQRDVELSTYNISASVLEARGVVESLHEEKNLLLILIDKVGQNGSTI